MCSSIGELLIMIARGCHYFAYKIFLFSLIASVLVLTLVNVINLGSEYEPGTYKIISNCTIVARYIYSLIIDDCTSWLVNENAAKLLACHKKWH